MKIKKKFITTYFPYNTAEAFFHKKREVLGERKKLKQNDVKIKEKFLKAYFPYNNNTAEVFYRMERKV